ncbi:ACT domain-containing protein [Quillaja saponaria]|uniref:ACT domain-containing protein ACR n=1 Tax=Quillaja saponaria TaxID=32244 RepID=A0AAD7PY28_QUISA|nr:ACT domain-containing protein [Quillaja saponaria]
MGIPCDDLVVIQHGKKPDEPSVITVNCPDKAGLACDICRIILEFGLCISRADFSTDGRWCYIVLWIDPHPKTLKVDWESLNNRLFSACPSCLFSYYFSQESNSSSPASVYLLKVWCIDQKGLLHDVTDVLCKRELIIQRVKVMPTPDGRALDMFFITDGLGLLHRKQRRDDVCDHLMSVLGDCCISCELQLAGAEFGSFQVFSSLPSAVAEELFSCGLSDQSTSLQSLSPDLKTLKRATVAVDNSLSPVHTLLQIQCVDQKGLCYDIMRISKDYDIQSRTNRNFKTGNEGSKVTSSDGVLEIIFTNLVFLFSSTCEIAYARISSSVKGCRNIDLFVQQKDGKKIVDPEDQIKLCSCLKEEMLHPLRVIIVNRGPDTELLVANPVELSGKGRPRVFYDVTSTLKSLGICIFLAEIGRHSTSEHQWEVYRFLLDESREFPLASSRARTQIVDKVRRTLMGWRAD